MGHLLRKMIASATSFSIAFAPVASRANPLGGKVVAGSATIQGQGTPQTIINQSSQRAIINWNTFNVAPGETTQFIQPNAASVALNRITGGLGPSQIFGTLTANGSVYLINADGFLFGPSAVINTGSFLATTHDIANSDFMAGTNNFTISGNPSASIVNEGMITAATGGFAALVAPGVRNDGVITAKLGTVALASGNEFTLDLYGDSLIALQPSDAISAQVLDVATGQPLTSLVQNTGTLKANGGSVQLTAVAVRQVLDSVINTSGVVEANTVGTHAGQVIFGAATNATSPAGAPAQTVKVSGTVSAAGTKRNTKGGLIQITGENILLTQAKINASGRAGGGTILIGGDYHGGAPDPLLSQYGLALQPWAVPTATTVTADSSVTLNASATVSGNGGKVVVWSNQATTLYGTILAQGGSLNGDGGNVETSGASLNIGGASVSTAAPNGQGGHWLLDPDDFTIDASEASTINSTLAGGSDVIVATSAGGTGGDGDIFVNAPISWSTNNALTLDAYRGLFVNANITASGNTAAILLYYNDGGSSGALTTGPDASITLSGSSPSLAINGTGYTLIQTQQELENIPATNFSTGQSGHYALANDISLTGTFTPIGGIIPAATSPTLGFDGVFEGLGHSISNLLINDSQDEYLGLFSIIGPNGEVSNLGVQSANMTVSGSVFVLGFGFIGDFGILAGENEGDVYNSYTSGTLSASNTWDIGGLIGNNTGNIQNSYSTAAITATGSGVVGGLVGENLGTIDSSYATGAITGNLTSSIGGLVGVNTGISLTTGITQSYASGNVTSTDGGDLGGLVGENFEPVTNSYATGSVTSVFNINEMSEPIRLGGLIGYNSGIISNSYSTGSVATNGPAIGANGNRLILYEIGGLVGGNVTNIASSFSTGPVSAGSDTCSCGPSTGDSVGSLAGSNGGTISNSYATGTTSDSDGLIGSNTTPGTGATFSSAGSISAVTSSWDFVNTWYTGPSGLPMLQGFSTPTNTTPESSSGPTIETELPPEYLTTPYVNYAAANPTNAQNLQQSFPDQEFSAANDIKTLIYLMPGEGPIATLMKAAASMDQDNSAPSLFVANLGNDPDIIILDQPDNPISLFLNRLIYVSRRIAPGKLGALNDTDKKTLVLINNLPTLVQGIVNGMPALIDLILFPSN
jgi:filamentous hemagglutinin family protein